MKNTRNHRTKTRKVAALGFTMLELLTVVAIVGILAALGVTNYEQTIERNRKENITKAFASLFRKARQKAVTDGVPVWVGVYWGFLPANNNIKLPSGSYDTAYAVVGNPGSDNAIAFDNGHVNNVPLGEVTEIVGLVHSPYGARRMEVNYSITQFGVNYGCRLADGVTWCGNMQQAVIRPDGFVYGKDGSGNLVLAQFAIGTADYDGVGILDRYSLAALSTSGAIKVRY